jgi:hypothetical protein
MSGRALSSLVLLHALAVSSASAGDAPASDWKDVARVLGVEGKLLPDGTYRVDVPRTDPVLRNRYGFVVPPSMVLTYVAFAGTPADATVFGDTCMLEDEVNPVLDALRAGGVEVVAIHNHMLGGVPSFVFLHFQARGEAAAVARTVRRAWDLMGKPHPPPERKPAPAPAPDWKAVSEVLGLPGVLQPDGTYKVSLPRPHLATSLDGVTLPAGVGLACWVGFAPCDCGLTKIMGDTCLRRAELQRAIDAYRRGGVEIIAIHNHMHGTSPELIFCHFGAEGDAIELARAVRAAWEGLAPPKAR